MVTPKRQNTAPVSAAKASTPIKANNKKSSAKPAAQAVQLEAQALIDSALRAATAPRHDLTSVKLTLNKVGTIELNFLPSGFQSWEILNSPRTGAERVAEAERLLKEGKVYPRGCSEFVCAVLGIPYELANDLMGATPVSKGKKPPYPGLVEGDVVGWKKSVGSGHVAIYIKNDTNRMFIDVQEPGATPRAKNGFYDHELFKSSRF